MIRTGLSIRIRVVAALALACAIGSNAPKAVADSLQLSEDPPARVGRLNLLVGDVSFSPGGLEEWTPATLNYPLTAADRLWTDVAARAEIHAGAAAIRLDSRTQISILNLDDQDIQIGATEGSVNIRLWDLDAGSGFSVATPNASISLLEPGSYRIDVSDETGTSIVVRQGSAEVSAGVAVFQVRSGDVAGISGYGSVGTYLTSAPMPDEWDRWSANRDSREEGLVSVRYVPRDLIGIEDLDEYGTWITLPGYGAAWMPAVLPVGWAPYRDGRWAWVEPWGWTWIDAAPWGFAPFHYGRWAFMNARWAWVPGTFSIRPVYAPALVVFVGGDDWQPSTSIGAGVGWFPLGPREIYIPSYRVSTTYVQRINITAVGSISVTTIESINVTRTVYVNRQVPQAVTVVPSDSFMRAQNPLHVGLTLAAAEISRAPVIGMGARAAPLRESILVAPLLPRASIARPSASAASRSVQTRIAPTLRNAAPSALRPSIATTALQPQPLQPQPALPQTRPQATQPLQPQTGTTRAPLQPQTRPQATQPLQPQTGTTRAPLQPQTRPQATQPLQPQTRPALAQPTQPQQTQPQQTQPQQTQPQQTQPQAREPVDAAGSQKPGASSGKPGKEASEDADHGDAKNRLTSLTKKRFPEFEKTLADARKVKNIKLDFKGIEKGLADARATLASAQKDLDAGNAAAALEKTQAVEHWLDDQEKLVAQSRKNEGERD